jgi:hypothetical protein
MRTIAAIALGVALAMTAFAQPQGGGAGKAGGQRPTGTFGKGGQTPPDASQRPAGTFGKGKQGTGTPPTGSPGQGAGKGKGKSSGGGRLRHDLLRDYVDVRLPH